MKKYLILTFIFLLFLSSPVFASLDTCIDDVEWRMSKSEVIENIELQIIDSNTGKEDGHSFTTLLFNNENFVNAVGTYEMFFVNDHLLSIKKVVYTGEKNIAEKYYKKFKLDLKSNDSNYSGNNYVEKNKRGVKQLLLNNSGYEGEVNLIEIDKADLTQFNIEKNNIPRKFEYIISYDVFNNSSVGKAMM